MQLRRLKRLRETGKNWKQVNNWHTPQLQLIHLFLSSIVLEPPATQGESELPHPLSDEGPQRVRARKTGRKIYSTRSGGPAPQLSKRLCKGNNLY